VPACLFGAIMNESENQTRRYRSFGIVRHTFPEMTPTEKAFVPAFAFCGVVATMVVRRSMSGIQSAIGGVSLCVMGAVLGYWMRHEPAAFLQLLWFPFTGWTPRWPRIVLMCIRAFGVVCFFSCLSSFPLVFLPASWTKSPVAEVVILAFALSVSAFALRKRSRSPEPATHPEQTPS